MRSFTAGLCVLIACATPKGSQAPSDHLVLSIQDLVCLDCGKELEERALTQSGVRAAHFDEKKVELDLDVAPGTDPKPIIDTVEREPVDGRKITAVVGGGQGRFAPFQPLDPSWDAKLLSQHGEDVASFEPTPGRVTVVDFYADWCGPCHELDDVMHELLRDSPAKLAYRRLNVVDWESPLAKHYLANASELPYVIVLDTRGQEVTRLSGLKVDELKAAIAKGAQP